MYGLKPVPFMFPPGLKPQFFRGLCFVGLKPHAPSVRNSGVLDAVVAFDDAADDVEFLFGAVEERLGARELGCGDGGDEADAHVEGAHHFVLRNLAELAEVFEDRQHGPGADLDLSAGSFGQNAGKVFGDAAAGDVGHAGGEPGGDQFLNDVEVAAVRLHERGAGFLLDGSDVLRGLVAADFEEELAGERVAVGVEAGGGNSDEDVAGFDADAGDHFVAVDGANDKAGEVVFAVGVEAGHLGSFAADESTAIGAAGVGEAGDDGLGDIGIEFAGGEVIEEEKGRGALDGDVVDAMIDEVCADGLVEAEGEGDFELGANAVGRADQDGVFPALQVEAKEGAESSDAA